MAEKKNTEKKPSNMMEVIKEFSHGKTLCKVGEKKPFSEGAKAKYKDFLREVK